MAKNCTKCSLLKTLDNFRCHKSKRHLSGYAYHSWCKECEKDYRISEQGRKAKRRSVVKYKKNNPDKRKLWDRITHQRRLQNDPEYRLYRVLNTKRYKALKKELNETLTTDEWYSILETFDYKCFKCNSKEVTIDHYRPLSKGNPLTSNNAIPLCRSCNSSKGAKNPEEFFTEKEIDLIELILEGANL